jgi:predicted Fe-Mo cluster-binding NifX family protein
MRIAITATGPDLEAKVDPRFGRCPYFLVVETDDLSFEVVKNPNVALGGGAGIQSARLMAERGVKGVLTGNCGPNAHQTLSAAGIAVIVGCSGAVREVIEQYKAGRLAPAAQPNVAGHFGMGGGSGDPTGDTGPAFGPGMGRGGGRGMGGGRGLGMGRGMGMGRGGGRGIGGGRGHGSGMGAGGGFAGSQPTTENAAVPDNELSLLKQQAEAMGQQMQQIQQRIKELEQEKKNG